MRKSFVASLFVVLASFATTGCATGGYLGPNPYPGPLGQVMAGNLALTCPGDYFVGPPINRCLRSMGGDIGRYSSYPMYRGGMSGPQLSQADKLAIFCGLGGSGVAMLMNAGLSRVIGAGLISAASCEVAGAVMSRRVNNQRDNGVIVTPQPQQPVYWSHGAPVAVGMRPNRQGGPVSTSPSMAGDWRVSNRTSKRAELWDGEQFIARIEPWQSVQVDAPQNGYKAILLIPNRSGGLGQETAQLRSADNFNGWDILAPAVQ